ncbi:MAG: PTS sugar transporter subunit IIB [Mycoplasma sp.]|nr:PTS sugar transporter subunit IIB [Mycoplasma sp.]
MSSNKLKILAACGNGMGTSMLIRLKIEKIARKLNLFVEVEALSVGQSKSMTNIVDVIICSSYLVSEFNQNQRAIVIGIKNLMSDKEIEDALLLVEQKIRRSN